MFLGYGTEGSSQFFGIFSVLFVLIFVLIAGILIFSIVRGLSQWNRNNKSPRLTVNAKVVGKRIDVTHHHNHHSGHGIHTTSSTWYYVTFEFESGDRTELSVNGFQYGIIAEGDYGKLTFQGTRYIDFTRI